jgi:hypothetical protein
MESEIIWIPRLKYIIKITTYNLFHVRCKWNIQFPLFKFVIICLSYVLLCTINDDQQMEFF